MSTKNCVADFYVELSSQCVSKLGLANNPNLRNSITNAVINFRHYPFRKANKALWSFYYGFHSQREQTLHNLFNLQKHDYSEDDKSKIIIKTCLDEILNFSEEQFHSLATELLNQYRASYPAFLMIQDNCNYQEELDALKEVMKDHPLLLFKAVEKCKHVYKDSNFVAECVPYLLSKNATTQFYGLEMLVSKFKYTTRMRTYGNEIGTLLQAMYEDYLKTSNTFSPFEKLFVSVSQKMQKAEDARAIEVGSVTNFITFSSNIRSDASNFKVYVEMIEALEKTLISLHDAKLNLDEVNAEFYAQKTDSILFTAISNTGLIKRMLNLVNAYKEAQSQYDIAFQNLISFAEESQKTIK